MHLLPSEVNPKHKRKYFNNFGVKTSIQYHYPLETETFNFGLFSTREKAEQFIGALKNNSDLKWLYLEYTIKFFQICCFEIDSGTSELINAYVYNPDGSFYDGSLNESIEGAHTKYHFPGRSKSQQKFKTGDIVEYYGINRICLGIISGYSGDKEDIQSVQSKNILFDISDDSYVILYYDAEGEGLEGTTPHTHIPSYQVFEPQGYITSNVTSALKAALLK